jgi:hypothetical protein
MDSSSVTLENYTFTCVDELKHFNFMIDGKPIKDCFRRELWIQPDVEGKISEPARQEMFQTMLQTAKQSNWPCQYPISYTIKFKRGKNMHLVTCYM